MRDVFIDEVFLPARKNKDIYFTTPDMGAPSLDKFRKELPEQFIHSGICEQHMISMAFFGLTLMDKTIFCYAMAPFITSRCYEQIKCSVAAMDRPVCLVGWVGLGYADAGPTHYTTEDIATMSLSKYRDAPPSDVPSIENYNKEYIKKTKICFFTSG